MGWLDVVALIGGAVPGVGPMVGPVMGALGGALSDARHVRRSAGPASNDPVDIALWEIDTMYAEINDMLNRHEEESWVL